MHTHTYTYTYIYIHTFTHTHTHNIHTYTHIHIYTYTHLRTHTHTQHTHMHTHTHIHARQHTTGLKSIPLHTLTLTLTLTHTDFRHWSTHTHQVRTPQLQSHSCWYGDRITECWQTALWSHSQSLWRQNRHLHIHTHIRTYTHTYAHTHTHTHIRTYIYQHIYTLSAYNPKSKFGFPSRTMNKQKNTTKTKVKIWFSLENYEQQTKPQKILQSTCQVSISYTRVAFKSVSKLGFPFCLKHIHHT